MLIETKTDQMLLLRRPASPPAWYHSAPYVVAVLVAVGVLVSAYLNRSASPRVALIAGITIAVVSGTLIALGFWQDWENAEIRCTFDKARGIIELRRNSPRFRRCQRFPLDDFEGLDLKEMMSTDELNRFAIRIRIAGRGRIRLPDSVSRTEQEKAMSAIQAFLK